ncbi:hypothetical protein JXR93_06710, partial [bacterium]|nr:hypothetical protein [bacterium]
KSLDDDISKYPNASYEIGLAKDMVVSILTAMDSGTDKEDDLENACSVALNEIDFDLCSIDKYIKADWEIDQNYFMKDFGKRGIFYEFYDKIELSYQLDDADSSYKCIGSLYDYYNELNQSVQDVTIKIQSLLYESNTKLTILETLDGFYTGEEYINYYPCDFNENEQLNIDYCSYDFIFCSKSLGWFKSENDCALNRQEVFLLKFDKNPYQSACEESCRSTNDKCSKGCSFECLDTCAKECLSSYSDEMCETDCINDICASQSCVSTCVEERGDECYISGCSSQCEIDCEYEASCVSDCIFNTCIIDNCKKSCRTSCITDECSSNCSNICIKDDCVSQCVNESCGDSTEPQYCKYNCEKQCNPLKIDEYNSRITLFFREVTGTEKSGSNCTLENIFPKKLFGEDVNPFCTLNFNLFERN